MEWKDAIKPIRESDIPKRQYKTGEFYEKVVESLAQNNAIVVDPKMIDRNLYGVYYGIRRHMVSVGVIDSFTFRIDRVNNKIYISRKR